MEKLLPFSKGKYIQISIVSCVVALFVMSPVVGIFSFTSAASAPVFSSEINLSNDANNAQYPMVANSGNNVYVVWTEGSHGIYFRTSPDGGITWSPLLTSAAMKLSQKGGSAAYPQITANGSNVYVLWGQTVKGEPAQLFFTSSTNYGVSFSTPIQITSGTDGAVTPVISAWGNDVYVAYGDNKNQLGYVMASTDAGVHWTTPFLFGNVAPGHEPQLASWGQNVYAISNSNLTVSSNNGATWTDKTPKSGLGSEPWIAASGTNVYAVWETKGAKSAVFGTISHDSGSTFSSPVFLSANARDAFQPQISASGSNVYLALHQVGAKPQAWMEISNDAGITWNNNVSLSGIGKNGWATIIAISGANVFTIWGEQISSSTTNWNAYVGYSADNGATWTSAPGIDVSNNVQGLAAPNVDIASSSIAAFGIHGFASWEQTTGTSTTDQIWFAAS
jgi:hypothetical protein